VVIEVLSAAVLGLLALRVHPLLVLAAAGLAAAGGIVLGAVDASTQGLPDKVLIPTLVAVAALLVAAGIVDHRPERLGSALAGAAAAFAG
jgi:leader peptidase (prepilin peptidase)/N-methyltransferase